MLALSLTLATGCTTVKPWAKGNLAKKEMAWQPIYQKSIIDGHIYFAKEAASGGGSAGGGGCGCN